MSYWGLNAVFLAVVVVVVVAAVVSLVVRAGDASARRRLLAAVGVTMAVLLVMTAVFDNVMIGVGLVGYEPSLISGAFVGIAPLEDFAYAIAAVLLLPSLWVLLGGRDGAGSASPASPASAGSPKESGR
ncbi:lycopene cyclase domain-containing protein [Herbiconiux sp. CPCC 203407]|uniref:Lycopene cyclase domain-containing protein n=1 Tax=Herbiconiux oxytropis TaxID=2970915 RepID=A0AA41XGC7_9MICO|nr:lycopene cyclase domain-containing protein [Herbiconiux oxytropis]MCS5722988.1 lycopene cyclase domain-containing protein [Herbiconiux oxytropis]MCS5725200.1 lycopene cyclase domain-containing protein [Herbiconiux oxytropis]